MIQHLLLPLLLVAAQEVPTNDGWVTDRAGILNPGQEVALEALMESYKAGTGHDVAVLTVEDLGGKALESFSLEVARTWKLGNRDLNDGVLLLVSKNDRKMRIEVGRGLEGGLTDSIAGRIIRDVITPYFKAGDYNGGLQQGVLAIHAAIGGDYGPIEQTTGARRRSPQMGLLALFPFLFLFFILSAAGRRGGGGGSGWVFPLLLLSSMGGGRSGGGGWGGGGGGGGGFSGFGGGGGFSGGGASGGW